MNATRLEEALRQREAHVAAQEARQPACLIPPFLPFYCTLTLTPQRCAFAEYAECVLRLSPTQVGLHEREAALADLEESRADAAAREAAAAVREQAAAAREREAAEAEDRRVAQLEEMRDLSVRGNSVLPS